MIGIRLATEEVERGFSNIAQLLDNPMGSAAPEADAITINIPVDALPAIVVIGLMIVVPLFYWAKDRIRANRKKYFEYQRSLREGRDTIA